LGSDWPVAPSDAVGILADAQLRRPHAEPDAVPINPDQALTAMEALRGLTVEPYRTIGRTGGVLTVGGPADITVLDRDPRAVTPDSLGAAEVLLTIVGGRVVVDTGETPP
jgi:predicted amidohydrolase YtcJ